MAFDNLVFEHVINLISSKIENGKIVKISQISNEEFLLVIRNYNYNFNLLISTHPAMSYINLISSKIESNHQSSNLLMLFRKHLELGKITSFKQLNDDRIVLLEVENKDDYYNTTIRRFYIELIGKASNVILTDENNKIIDALKRIPLEYNNLRTIQPNITYTLPDKPLENKLAYDLVNQMDYEGVSEQEIIDKISRSNEIFITTPDNGKKDFHLIPLTYLKGSTKSYDIFEGLEEFFKDTLSIERHRQIISNLDKFVKNEIKKNEKKIDKLNQELSINQDGIIYKKYGDLLLTYYQGKRFESDQISIVDEEDNNEYKIKIDPTIDVYKNANNYYKKYQKSKTAIIKLNEQIDICKESKEYFQSIKFSLENATVDTVAEIKEELEGQGYLRPQKKTVHTNKKGKVKEKVYKPLKFKVFDTIIYAGQNNLQNEYLTFKMASKSHMYLHVALGHGAHVVVFADKLEDRLIKEAARIAAYYSSYKMSSTVPVYYTLVKNVKKIPGGKPGKVIISNQKTIYVDPDGDIKKYLL